MREIIAGITEDNEIYTVEIRLKNEQRYFAMSGNTVEPVTLKEAKNIAHNGWMDYFSDPETIREMNERLGTNFKSALSATKYVLEVDGELHGFDNSTMLDEIEYKRKTWLFQSRAGGQNIERKLKVYFIPPATFNKLMNIWDKYHLKEENPPDLPEIPEQDREKLLKKAIGIIRFGKTSANYSEEHLT